eukprot:scaffold49171_cov37-Cyclotella_meneghiniana.AAC.2
MAKSQNVHDKRPLRPSPCLELEQTTVNGKCIRFHLWRAGLVRAWVGTRASPQGRYPAKQIPVPIRIYPDIRCRVSPRGTDSPLRKVTRYPSNSNVPKNSVNTLVVGYPTTLRSSRVGSPPTKYPYPKAFYPGAGCRVNTYLPSRVGCVAANSVTGFRAGSRGLELAFETN